MVIRSGDTEEKQSCLHAERAENIPCEDVSRKQYSEHCLLKVALCAVNAAATLERLLLSVM